ncbi:hypothetical protein BJ508DRAFT_328355 [Ascobolus immersus RN42]|uniref:Uncharacterized protein n=1 Tax=Ascobolus immersus RN42 TaxID=1160509 RepID=A0A3N4I233_ASCIM|nr:hypothetical protein BJ508DRAFT_328355 [Ascobolus immersus RN42]
MQPPTPTSLLSQPIFLLSLFLLTDGLVNASPLAIPSSAPETSYEDALTPIGQANNLPASFIPYDLPNGVYTFDPQVDTSPVRIELPEFDASFASGASPSEETTPAPSVHRPDIHQQAWTYFSECRPNKRKLLLDPVTYHYMRSSGFLERVWKDPNIGDGIKPHSLSLAKYNNIMVYYCNMRSIVQHPYPGSFWSDNKVIEEECGSRREGAILNVDVLINKPWLEYLNRYGRAVIYPGRVFIYKNLCPATILGPGPQPW